MTDLTDTALAADINQSHLSLTHFKARFILAVTEFDERDLARDHGAPSTVVWMQRKFGLKRSTGFEYLGVGRKLRKFPRLAQAFLDAEFSYSIVRLLLRYLTEDNEEELLELAAGHTYAELAAKLAGRDQPDAKPRLNKISVVTDPETGEVRIWGVLDAQRGAELKAALKISELANLIDIDNVDEEVLNDPAAVEKLIDDARTPQDPETPAPAQKRPNRTRFGTHLSVTVFTAFMGLVHMVRSHPIRRVRAPGAEVNVLFTQDDRAYIPGHHGGLPGQLMRQVLNGAVRYHLLDSRGLTLKVTRAARLATEAQIKALLAVWEYRCAGPGCDHSSFLEFHHIQDYAKGGLTALSNLIPLCSGCHALVSAGLMTIFVDTDPVFLRFRLPGGESYTSENRSLVMKDVALGEWADKYLNGPVPHGDEDQLQVWEHEDSFADLEDEKSAAADSTEVNG
ncbi:MAG: HNH endonuclease signature motif containing protein [Corynebacterium sp.]|uniref:HNH endonuclease signature motif containing protein n=1 Tax=Corynebacterium sp. TaxID=1720 RepID=UPI0026DF7300|nr:HNH endonuclease signature motif containing protein [Corynebacterium sp.]MDO5669608.1 HNH endonuclease signature motif containing protein [Corynebacterium sp.]